MSIRSSLRRWLAGPTLSTVAAGFPDSSPARRAELALQGAEEAKVASLWAIVGASTSDDALIAVGKAALAEGWHPTAVARGLETAYRARVEARIEEIGPDAWVHQTMDEAKASITIPPGMHVDWFTLPPEARPFDLKPTQQALLGVVEPPDFGATDLSALDLPARVATALRKNGINSVERLEEIGINGWYDTPGIGFHSADAIRAALQWHRAEPS